MRRPALPSLLPILVLALAALLPASASAQVIAQNDSMDWSVLDTNPSEQVACPCFCEYECFGSTFTAPDDMSANYIYLLYGSLQPVDLFMDFYILEGPGAFSPGTPFVDQNQNESIGIFLPLQSDGTELYEIQVAQSQVTPPQIESGEEFSVAFCYNYGKESQTVLEPNLGHGPIHDGQVDGLQSGTNWIQYLNGLPADFEDPCSIPRETLTWTSSPTSGDWAIRVTDQPIDWLNPPGGDDDDDDDDDDATDDDDVADDDDDDATGEAPVVLGVSPSQADEGVDTVVAITGQNFDESATAFVGGFAMGNVNFVSAERIDATVPRTLPASATPYEVTVNTQNGSNSLPGAFTVNAIDDGDGNNDCGCQNSIAAGTAAPWMLGLPALVGVRRRR